jgi:uncharacterized Zn finger protein (UPF0148 family)
MTLVTEHDGTGEWLCPSCGRHLLISREPEYKKTVLVEGDPSADHIRVKKKLETEEQRDTSTAWLPGAAEDPIDDPRLIPWLNWMEESGFEDLWDDDD